MLEWLVRGLRKRRITTGYPDALESPPSGFVGQLELLDPVNAPPELAAVCPTGAIEIEHGRVSVGCVGWSGRAGVVVAKIGAGALR